MSAASLGSNSEMHDLQIAGDSLAAPANSDAAGQVAKKIMDTAPVIMHFIRSKLKERPETMASVPQLRVLGFIDKHPGCSLTPLSDFLGIASPSASTMIDRLVKGGLVVRAVDPTSRRNVTLDLTDTGRSELYRARQAAIGELASHVKNLSAEDLAKIDVSMGLLKDLFSSVYSNINDACEDFGNDQAPTQPTKGQV